MSWTDDSVTNSVTDRRLLSNGILEKLIFHDDVYKKKELLSQAMKQAFFNSFFISFFMR